MNQTSLPVQILVISLQRSLDRRRQVEKEMQKISLPWTFLDAVDGSTLAVPPVEYKPNKVKRLQGYELTSNEIGCFLSHKKCWRRCLDTGLPTLILEDDLVLSSHFEESLRTLIEAIPQWNFVRLHGLYEVPFRVILEKSGVQLVKNLGDAVGTAAYLLKPEIAEQLIKYSVDIYEPVDHFLEHQQKHGIEYLAIRPYPVNIAPVESTITDRSERQPVKGYKKYVRSIARAVDRVLSPNPWFPK
jgi:glycosyl transferase family 25